MYNAYHHAFEMLRQMPPVQSAADNERLTQVLRRLVDEHGAAPRTWLQVPRIHLIRGW